MARLPRRCGPRSSVERPRDAGTSLLELMIGMTLMGVFMTIFSAAIFTMYRSTNKAESVNVSSAQLNLAFTRLDSSVRYASAISVPGRGSDGNWYVELLTANNGSRVCSQLRINTASQQLQQRTWTPPVSSANVMSPWTPIASNVTNGDAPVGASTQPFTLIPASGSLTFQQLQFRLAAGFGSGGSATTSVSVVSFTAMNSILNSTSTACNDAGRP